MHSAILFAPGLYASGQPTIDDLAALASAGVRSVINLRAADEQIDYDEASEAERLGLSYTWLPIAGPDAVTAEAAACLAGVLDQARMQGDVLIHCASSNRVGALIALDRGIAQGAPRDEALAIGRAAGMTSLEPLVTRLLDQQFDTNSTVAAE